MSKHTPTPWKVSESHFIDAKTDKGFTQEVAYCGDCAEGERAANARHIVHCVNNYDRLVEALREVCDMQTRLKGNATETHIELDDVCRDLRTVLAQLDTKGEE